MSRRLPAALLPTALILLGNVTTVAMPAPIAVAQELRSLETAETLFRAARLSESLTHYQQVLTDAQQSGNDLKQAQALLGMGRTHYWLNQPDEALPFLTQAQELYISLKKTKQG